MNNPRAIQKVPLFIFIAALCSCGVGAIIGGATGSFYSLLMIAANDVGSSFDCALFIIGLFATFIVGAIYGAIPGTIGGLLLGVTFCFARKRWLGIVGGGLAVVVTAIYFFNGVTSPNIASNFEKWIFCGLVIIGGSLVGHIVSGILLQLLYNDRE